MTRYNRSLTALHILSDTTLAGVAFILAYAIRFHSGLIPVTKGIPPFRQYLNVLPFVGVLVPVAFHFQGLYQLRRGRSRVDDFFAVFVGSILAVLFGVVATLYVQTYFATDQAKALGALEVSQLVWGLFLGLNVALTFASRELIREGLERRWRAGIGLKRILIAGSGELGRLVADKILEHRELGYQIAGFIDDRSRGDHLGYRGLPLLGSLDEAAEIISRESIDHLYLALPPEQHMQMIALLEAASRELVDVKVVPDLLQVIALRARLEDLDGIPVINVNDVPLQGLNSLVKRLIDVALSLLALAVVALPLAIVAFLIRITSKGPVLYRQERMGLDGRSFSIVKFRSMYLDAEGNSGPVWAVAGDPRVTPLGRFLRSSNLDELPQL
jgi:FlaA1/EpsC-like NDP-sugar epimerase